MTVSLICHSFSINYRYFDVRYRFSVQNWKLVMAKKNFYISFILWLLWEKKKKEKSKTHQKIWRCGVFIIQMNSFSHNHHQISTLLVNAMIKKIYDVVVQFEIKMYATTIECVSNLGINFNREGYCLIVLYYFS